MHSSSIAVTFLLFALLTIPTIYGQSVRDFITRYLARLPTARFSDNDSVGFRIPMIIGLTTHHPVENYHKVASRPATNDHATRSGLHGHFGRYSPYDSQEWWPEVK